MGIISKIGKGYRGLRSKVDDVKDELARQGALNREREAKRVSQDIEVQNQRLRLAKLKEERNKIKRKTAAKSPGLKALRAAAGSVNLGAINPGVQTSPMVSGKKRKKMQPLYDDTDLTGFFR